MHQQRSVRAAFVLRQKFSVFIRRSTLRLRGAAPRTRRAFSRVASTRAPIAHLIFGMSQVQERAATAERGCACRFSEGLREA